MLPFFRKIRYRLAEDNQFLKYSRYAIGEIVLVVVGILIALYINNWNEQRKEREKFDLTLVEAQKELIKNIKEVRSIIKLFSNQDSILCRVLFDSLVVEEYLAEDQQDDLFNAGFWFTKAVLSSDSFHKLEQFNNIDERQDSILQELKDLNSRTNQYIEEVGEWMEGKIVEEYNSIKKYDWFHDWLYRRYDNDGMLNFFIGDPEYLNMVTSNLWTIHTYVSYLSQYDAEGLIIYRRIHDYLINQDLQVTDSLLFEYQPEMFKHYLGKYESVWSSDKNFVHDDSAVISLEEDRLIYTRYRLDGPAIKFQIVPIEKYLFRTESGGYFHLNLNDQEMVENFRLSTTRFVLDMKKVR